MVLHWDGARWSRQSIGGRLRPALNGVSCPSATACTAVGGDFTPAQGLAEHWDGTAWSLQHLRLPAAATALRMTAVSCPSIQRCTAVGYAATSQGQLTLAERWNGHGWTVQTTQNPAPA